MVLRLWRAYSSPDALPDKLQPEESIEAEYARERRIRDMAGVPVVAQPQANQMGMMRMSQRNFPANGAVLASSNNLATGQGGGVPMSPGMQQGAALADRAEENILHTPFNARELMWAAQIKL